ncbi:ABC transporter permease subunit [Pseudobacteriovorax antillogorgiicola]|uniref:Amino acid/amide ABC transporter membrane protein 1, HAAT family n=1 Tax=Pseudobacteriovorax antillogorgiicola TaxID=1513793 RepID=A0A1Y6CW54_9BACT|nr:branched-chain amino acid ABC transporter permease LivH [Pseudobacteriovorax antillogorgiicola]TCS44419.1 amino acid/amide ABC transporter membrane protein 1 (HAAT family) [Pseudobacteriovorax antillogorgiicola]SMF79092.1 amino acid/amide ABC transporter membrane protein 1, HAAT family [Pseudobacteriovorax antillogorgiicola]
MDLYTIGQQLINGLVLGSTYGLIAVGYTMVYGIIGMINFAHGEIYMISAYLTAICLAVLTWMGITWIPITILLVLFGTIIFTSIYGFVIERVAYKPLRGSSRLTPLISAIGMSLILQNYVMVSQGARNQAVPTLIEGAITIGSEQHYLRITYVQLGMIVVSFLAMALLTFIIGKTSLGRACRATQQDMMMARLLGINTDNIISSVFVIGSIMAAIAGLLITFNYGSFDFYIGFKAGVKAFTAAVLGGIGSLPGAMLGGIILGMSEGLFSGFVNSDYKDVFAFSLLVVFLIFRPSGLLGRPEVEKV